MSLPLHGQMSYLNDTIKISEVVISTNKSALDQAGYKRTSIDSMVLSRYSSSNLSDMLSENTNIFIKSYGMGGTATPAFRGTGAGHTLIDWNGININSPMLGQSDLSLLPVGLIDDVQIFFGGASLALNNGGIGGTINLETKPVWKKETLISLNSGVGSFSRYSELLKVKTGNERIQTVTKAFYQTAENDFRYLNNINGGEPIWQKRNNDQFRQRGLIQELYFQSGKNITSVNVWYQSSDRNLPATMLTQQQNSNERQFDESVRAIVKYDHFKGPGSFSFTGAWMMNRLNYYNQLASIDSKNLSENLTLKANYETLIGGFSNLKIALDEQSNVIISNNYEHSTRRNTATFTASMNRNQDRFGTTILFREILDRKSLLLPDFSAGIQFRLIDDSEYFIKANISRNSKIPTMNDMYWFPGGNPSLKNEYSFIYEVSYEMKQKISYPLNLKYDLTFFRYSIKDMIQWHLGEYSYWNADNIQSVTSSGLESSVSLDYVRNYFNASFKTGYSFTRARNGNSGIEDDLSARKQLVYVPENQVNSSLRVGFRNIYTTMALNFVDKRYTESDNSKYLPCYMINDFIAGIKLPAKNSLVDLNFSINNFFNITYQSIAYYPLPGRTYFLKILVQLIK